jgi:hypothetical protein
VWWGVPRDRGLRDRHSIVKWIVIVGLIVLLSVAVSWLLISFIANSPSCGYDCVQSPTTSRGLTTQTPSASISGDRE